MLSKTKGKNLSGRQYDTSMRNKLLVFFSKKKIKKKKKKEKKFLDFRNMLLLLQSSLMPSIRFDGSAIV